MFRTALTHEPSVLAFDLLGELSDASLLVYPSGKGSSSEVSGHPRVVIRVLGAVLEFPCMDVCSFPSHKMAYNLTVLLCNQHQTVALLQEHRRNRAHEVLDVFRVYLSIDVLEPAETIVSLKVGLTDSLTVV
jgi:hypothetical protein